MDVASLKDDFRERMAKQGLTSEKIELQLTKLDVEFLLHSFVNKMELLSTEERMKLYLAFLQRELQRDK